jgi:uncharacterized integral membrane protein (TIGR00697 family)
MTFSFRFISIAALFITCLITANIMIVKQIAVGGLVLPAAIIIFPLSYICGDVLTEVYGYRQARLVIWLGFICNLIAVMAFWIGEILPPASIFEAQSAYERILGSTPKFLIASFAAYLAGEFINSFIMAKLKIATRGKWLWLRTISSTLAGEGIDTFIVLTIAFGGVLPFSTLVLMMVSHWVLKSAYEAVATPLTYVVINYLKQKEHLDVYDYKTNFNPFTIG